ncbi:ArnT family glycosyltransferase [Aurantibacillus circumpalustris]|uniref:ArnT family glycosyltransferase n=1 Tax=Aurantibacillus circumpalustris TaxID=3036359 RepID=UPI00295BEB78|nr:glycosyltransferase family 39 protein [Aurantibacillus circumpalustris]
MYPKLYFIKYIILIVIIAIPIFGFLDTMPIRTWDEARIAINAIEMFHNGNFIVTYFDHTPEMWNTKPPLLIWCQVVFMHIVGTNEIAIRLPSALAVFATCMAILVFSQRYLKNFWLAFIAILTLITCDGYLGLHVSRTGDYDAMLTCFTTISCLFFFAYTETKQTKFLYLFFTAVLLASYTKGIAGILFFPALGIYAIIQNQLMLFIKNKHFYIGFFSFLTLILSYYLIRETQNPGYISIVQENELGGRYLVSQGGQKFDFWFYFNNFRVYRLPDRYLLIPCGMLIGLFSKDNRIKKITLFLTLLVITYFIIISIGKTKLEWYDAPLYPFLSILIAFFIHYIFDALKTNPFLNQNFKGNPVPYILLFLLFIGTFERAWSKTYLPEEAPWDAEIYEIGYYLKNAIKGKYDLENKHLAYDGYKAQNTFYLRVLNDKGVNTHEKEYTGLVKNDMVIACQEHVKNYIRNNYLYTEKHEQGPVFTYTIYGNSKDTIQ